MNHKVVKFGAIVLFAAFLVGCGNTVPGSNSGATNSAASAPAANSAASSSATPTAATGNPTKGQTLFTQNCSGCHSTGTDTKVGPGLKNLFARSALPNGKQVTEQNIEGWITTGGGSMPAFPQLSDQDKADLAAYLKTLSS